MSTFFCPAPWVHMYQFLNNYSPCYTYTEKQKTSPLEYLNGDHLKNIKKQLLNGEVPSGCVHCKKREDLGLKSTRESFLRSKNIEFFQNKYFKCLIHKYLIH